MTSIERPSTTEGSDQPQPGNGPRAAQSGSSQWAPLGLAAATVAAGSLLALNGADPRALFLTAAIYVTVVGIWLSIIDIRTHRLPDRILFPSYGVLCALLALYALTGTDDTGAPIRAALTAALTGSLYWGMNRWGSMGLGDVKLGALLGLLLGWAGWSTAIAGPLIGFLLAFVVAVAMLLAGRGRKLHIAFGPYLIAGAIIAIGRFLLTN